MSALAVPSAYTGCRIAARYDGYRVPRLPLIEKGNQAPSPSGGLGWVLGVLGWVFSCTVMGVRCVQWWVLAVLNLAFTFLERTYSLVVPFHHKLAFCGLKHLAYYQLIMPSGVCQRAPPLVYNDVSAPCRFANHSHVERFWPAVGRVIIRLHMQRVASLVKGYVGNAERVSIGCMQKAAVLVDIFHIGSPPRLAFKRLRVNALRACDGRESVIMIVKTFFMVCFFIVVCLY